MVRKLSERKQGIEFRRGIRYNILLLKFWFDTGVGVTSNLKTALYMLGMGISVSAIGTQDWSQLILLGAITLAYFIFCFIFGYYWDMYELNHTQCEIGNERNPFVFEMRDLIKELESMKETLGEIKNEMLSMRK